MKRRKKKDEKLVEFFFLRAAADMSAGTNSSLEFLDYYSNCEDDDFVLSFWRHLIRYKWDRIKYYAIAYALIIALLIILYFIFVFFEK